jgi:hypothetical protein
MQLTVRYSNDGLPDYKMEKELGKVLEEYGWECTDSGYFINSDTNDGERDIEYRKEK